MDIKFASLFNNIFYLELKHLKYCTGTSRYAIYSYNIYVPRLVSANYLTVNAHTEPYSSSVHAGWLKKRIKNI